MHHIQLQSVEVDACHPGAAGIRFLEQTAEVLLELPEGDVDPPAKVWLRVCPKQFTGGSRQSKLLVCHGS